MSVTKFTVIHQRSDVIFQTGRCRRRIEALINQGEPEPKIHLFQTNISVGLEQEGQWFNLHVARLNLPLGRIPITSEKMVC